MLSSIQYTTAAFKAQPKPIKNPRFEFTKSAPESLFSAQHIKDGDILSAEENNFGTYVNRQYIVLKGECIPILKPLIRQPSVNELLELGNAGKTLRNVRKIGCINVYAPENPKLS